MNSSSRGDRERYAEYRSLVGADLLPRALRNAVLIFFLLQTFVFIPADWILFPENFGLFLCTRTALDVLLALVYFRTSRRWPLASSAVVCVAGAGVFLAMIAQTGGANSGYYVGLILLVTGMGVMGPLTGKQGLGISALLFAGYAALPIYALPPTDWAVFAQHLFFLGAACLEAGWACAYTDRMRYAEFCHQRELARARDELADLDRAKSRFSANVHHELRTPLTLILAPLDALRSGEWGELPERVQQMLATMHANGRRLHKMINDLLDLSKIESQELRIRRAPLRPAPLLEELIAGARPLAERKGVELTSDGLRDLPEINADREALEKVLTNLLGNALKFTERGDRIRILAEYTGTLGLRNSDSTRSAASACAVEDGQAEAIVIRIEDSGLGIPTDKLDAIFDRFAQVDSSATRRHEGTGIGLAIAKEMVELHDGRIFAESEGPGLGTTMHVWLPIGRPDEQLDEAVLQGDGGESFGIRLAIAALEADLGLGAGLGAGGPMPDVERSIERWEDDCGTAFHVSEQTTAPAGAPEVLVAEDNPDMRALLTLLLGSEFHVRAARNGREALDAVRRRAPALILSDVMMPEMSGIEFCRRIKSDEVLRSIPVVLVTSKAEREMKIEGLELGADDYVTKPFHPRELMARVRTLIRVRGLQCELAERNALLEGSIEDLRQTQVKLVQSERLAAVGELAAGIAHEVNNPVNFALNAVRAMEGVVKDFCSLAGAMSDAEGVEQRGEPPLGYRIANERESPAELAETLSELTEIVTEGLTRTHTLVGDLRDFAAPGRHGALEESVDLARGLRSTVHLLRHRLSSAGVEIELQVQPDLPRVRGDAGGLNQVFLNLIKNAVESFAEGGGSIAVSIERGSDRSVDVVVQDDGPGIEADVLPRLFEPFFTTKKAGSGTGLGLSISRRVVEGHGGTLFFEAPAGGGARFIVRLPVMVAGGERSGDACA